MNTATPTPSSATATDQPTSTESPSPVASLSPSPTPVVTATTSPLPTATLSPTPIPSLTPSPIVIPTQLAVDVAKLNAALKTSPPFTSELPPGEHSPLVAGQTGTDVVGTFYPLDSFAGDVDGLGYTVFPSAEEAAAALASGDVPVLFAIGEPTPFAASGLGPQARCVSGRETRDSGGVGTSACFDIVGSVVISASTHDGASQTSGNEPMANAIARAAHAHLARVTTLALNGPQPGPTDQPFESAAPAGEILFTTDRDGNWEVYRIATDGGDEENLTNAPGDDESPAWSPDGKHIAFISNRDGEAGGGTELYVMNADGSGQVNLSHSAGVELDPSWSPDGQRIIFLSNTAGTWDIWQIGADGSGAFQQFVGSDHRFSRPSLAPDGKTFAFAGAVDEGVSLTFVGSSSQALSITGNNTWDSAPAWNPAGTRLALASDRGHGYDIYSVDPNCGDELEGDVACSNIGLPLMQDSALDFWPSWSPDGHWLVFYSNRNDNLDLYLIKSDGTQLTRLTTNPGADFNPAWKPVP